MKKLILILSILCSSCSWQGQRHVQTDPNVVSEYWSMRFLWMSGGIELYTKTPYYTSGANIEESKTDPNAIEAAGIAVGNIGKAVIR